MAALTAAPLQSPLFPVLTLKERVVEYIVGRNGAWSRWFGALVSAVNAIVLISGSATFVTSNSVIVAFSSAQVQMNTDYRVALGGNANETFWISAKTVDGFTLNSSNAASVASLDWILTR